MNPNEILAGLNKKRLEAEGADKELYSETMQLLSVALGRNNDLEEVVAGIRQLVKKSG